MKNRTLILCASCDEKLWACSVLGNGQPVVTPATSEVPYFSPSMKSCPFCDQPLHVQEAQLERYWVKDEETGRVAVA